VSPWISWIVALIAGLSEIEAVSSHEIVLTRLPATIQVTAGADDYTWSVPAGVKILSGEFEPTLVFDAVPGRYLIQCKSLKIDWDKRQLDRQVFASTFVIAGGDPDGDDDDDDDDDDVPKIKAEYLITVRETADTTTALNALLSQLTQAPPDTIRVLHVDDDTQDPKLRPYSQQAKDLPWLILANGQGDIAWQGPLPTDYESIRKLVREHR
jgi:hypothetical protein